MEKLPEDFKAKWIAALRSGEYKQGTDSLCSQAGKDKLYCCLGVGYRVATGEDPTDTSSGYIDDELERIAHERGVPKGIVGNSSDNKIVRTLSRMNDGMPPFTPQQSFSKIADYIEKNL
jgi:hypothetical protein